MNNKIVVLGRGESLKRLNEIPKDINKIILVNEFWDVPYSKISYYKDPLINNFLKNKEIILVATPFCNFKNVKPFLNKYNVIKCFKTKFSKITRIGSSDKIFSILPDELIEIFLKNDNECKNVGSLGLGVVYAIHILKAKEIHICGLDFYEKGYYIPQNYNVDKEINKSEQIKKDWYFFFNRYKNIKFNVYTLAKFNLNLI